MSAFLIVNLYQVCIVTEILIDWNFHKKNLNTPYNDELCVLYNKQLNVIKCKVILNVIIRFTTFSRIKINVVKLE